MDTKRNPLFDSGIALAAVTAFLYCASAAYTGRYFGLLGLDGDVLDRNFQQMLYDGFLISVAPVLLVLFIYTLVRFLYSHGVLPGLNDELRKSWKRKRQYLRLKHWWRGKRKDSAIEQREKRHTVTCIFLGAIFFAFIMSLVYFESKGKDAALRVQSKIDSKSIPEHEMVTVSINGQALRLLYLMCGARNCAGVAPETRVVYYFPQNGHSYVLPPTKEKLPVTQEQTSK